MNIVLSKERTLEIRFGNFYFLGYQVGTVAVESDNNHKRYSKSDRQ